MRSQITNELNEMEIDVTPEQLERWKSGGVNIQKIMPNLTPAEREFIMSGITPDEWKLHMEDED